MSPRLNSGIEEEITYQGFKFRIYPNDSQKNFFVNNFGSCRFIYNHFLKEKQNYYMNNGKTLNYNNCSSSMADLKKKEGYEWLRKVNSQAIQQSLMNLETAYGKFFKKQSKFPKFKRKTDRQSFTLPQNFKFKDGELFLPKIKEGVKIKLHRPLTGDMKSITISMSNTGKYFASVLCKVPKKSKPKTDRSIGIDLGITDFIVLSNGEKVKNPNFNRKNKSKLSKAQKHLSRKTKGSKRQQKQRIKVARIHEKITNSRKDFQHKLSTKLVNEYDLIALEDLSINNMMKNHKLAYSIQDSSWSSFIEMLKYKALWYDKKVIKIDRFYPSSKTCNYCDYIVDKLPLNIRSWKCPKCSCEHDRDVNAAKNILRQGINLVYSPERCLTNVEMEALASSNTGETAVCEALKKKRNHSPKPLN